MVALLIGLWLIVIGVIRFATAFDEEATSALEALHLKVLPKTQVSDTVKPGRVIDQDPVAGTTVNPGTTVTIIVAKAPPDGYTLLFSTSAGLVIGVRIDEEGAGARQRGDGRLAVPPVLRAERADLRGDAGARLRGRVPAPPQSVAPSG